MDSSSRGRTSSSSRGGGEKASTRYWTISIKTGALQLYVNVIFVIIVIIMIVSIVKSHIQKV